MKMNIYRSEPGLYDHRGRQLVVSGSLTVILTAFVLVGCGSSRKASPCDVTDVINGDSLTILYSDIRPICFNDSVHPSLASWIVTDMFLNSEKGMMGFAVATADSLTMERIQNHSYDLPSTPFHCGHPWGVLKDTCVSLVTLGYVSDSVLMYSLQDFGDPASTIMEGGIVTSDYSVRYNVALFVEDGTIVRRYISGPIQH